MLPRSSNNTNSNNFIIRKRIVVICETSKCRYTFLACFLKELGETKFGSMSLPTFSLMFGGFGSSSSSSSSTHYSLHHQNQQQQFSTLPSALEFLQSQDENGGDSSSADFLSSNGNNNGSGVGGVVVVTILNSENTVAYEVVLIDSSNGLLSSSNSSFVANHSTASGDNVDSKINSSTSSSLQRVKLLANPTLACLEPILCDIQN